MPITYPNNPNLHLTDDKYFKGLPIQTNHGPLAVEYLERILLTINNALSEHPRTLAVRFDLRAPRQYEGNLDSNVITRFFESLKKQVACDTAAKRAQGQRIHPCTIRDVWVKESTDELGYAHYHVLLLVNRDRFHCLGHFNSDKTNLFSRIQKAWASALGMNPSNVKAGVHFPRNCMYHLDINSGTFNESYSALFYRVSYMAKISTKHYGTRSRAFGCSRK